MSEIVSYISPELLVLIPTLWGIGMVIKSTKLCNDIIPATLCILSIVLACAYSVMNGVDVWAAIWAGFTQGVILWLVAWLSYDKGIKRLQAAQTEREGDVDEDANI